jgi:hypothetical protein
VDEVTRGGEVDEDSRRGEEEEEEEDRVDVAELTRGGLEEELTRGGLEGEDVDEAREWMREEEEPGSAVAVTEDDEKA